MRSLVGALVRVVNGVLGVVYLMTGAIAAYNWVLTLLPLKYDLEPFLAMKIPGDAGYGLALITIGLLFIEASRRAEWTERAAFSLVGSILALALLLLQLMTVASLILSTLSGASKITLAELTNRLARVEILVGPLCVPSLIHSLKNLKGR